jgi:integrase
MAAERCLQKAGSLLDIRDDLVKLETDRSTLSSGRLSQLKKQLVREHGLKGLRDYDRQVLDIRTAAYIVLGITSGCRNHELADLRVGAVYSTEEDGEKFHWLKSTSLKTFTGATEWMVPEIAGSAVRHLERWSSPLRSTLKREIADLRVAISDGRLPTTDKARLMKTLHQREADCTRLFLGRTDSTGRIGALSLANFNVDLAGFAYRHGINWKPKTHQFRRTFANFVARNGMGDLRYLRHHFKHWSMDMTLLYAKNAAQEAEIFDEILETINTEKVRIVEHWLDDDVLITGGASSPIKTFRRNHKVAIEKDRRALAENISDKVTIRGTGHGWCMSDDNGCGGQGLYEATRCSDCKFAVIDDTHRVVWQGLWNQQVELLALDDIGESGKERVRRDIRRISSVLCGLGVDVAVPVEVA